MLDVFCLRQTCSVQPSKKFNIILELLVFVYVSNFNLAFIFLEINNFFLTHLLWKLNLFNAKVTFIYVANLQTIKLTIVFHVIEKT